MARAQHPAPEQLYAVLIVLGPMVYREAPVNALLTGGGITFRHISFDFNLGANAPNFPLPRQLSYF